jgi:hypothetical protein
MGPSVDLWSKHTPLKKILADFDLADAEISLQDKQRHVVSRAWMMRLLQ